MDSLKEIQWTDPHSIKPNPKNRNKHSTAQIDRLIELIKYQGFRHPLIVSAQTGMLVVGHGRLMAAKKMGLETVPVTVQEFESLEQEYAFAISDNAIASWAELDLSGINFDVPELGPDFDIKNLGVFDFKIDPSEHPSSGSEQLRLKNKFELGKIKLTCPAVMPEEARLILNYWCELTGEDAFLVEDDGSKTPWSKMRGV